MKALTLEMDLLFFQSMTAASAALCSLLCSIFQDQRFSYQLYPSEAFKVTLAGFRFFSSISELVEVVVGFYHLQWGMNPFYELFPAQEPPSAVL